MTHPTIAGHTFKDQPYGRVCDGCGKSWLDVLAQREYWTVGEYGVGHDGALSQPWIDELNAEVDRIWATVRPAWGDAAA